MGLCTWDHCPLHEVLCECCHVTACYQTQDLGMAECWTTLCICDVYHTDYGSIHCSLWHTHLLVHKGAQCTTLSHLLAWQNRSCPNAVLLLPAALYHWQQLVQPICIILKQPVQEYVGWTLAFAAAEVQASGLESQEDQGHQTKTNKAPGMATAGASSLMFTC